MERDCAGEIERIRVSSLKTKTLTSFKVSQGLLYHRNCYQFSSRTLTLRTATRCPATSLMLPRSPYDGLERAPRVTSLCSAGSVCSSKWYSWAEAAGCGAAGFGRRAGLKPHLGRRERGSDGTSGRRGPQGGVSAWRPSQVDVPLLGPPEELWELGLEYSRLRVF